MPYKCYHTGIDTRFCAHCVSSFFPPTRDDTRSRPAVSERIGPREGDSSGMTGSDGITLHAVRHAFPMYSPTARKLAARYPISGSIAKGAMESGTGRQGIWTRHGFSEWGREEDQRKARAILTRMQKNYIP